MMEKIKIDFTGLTYTDGFKDCVARIKSAVAMGLTYEQAVECADTAVRKTEGPRIL